MKIWYAVLMNREDTEWGFGSYDLEDAITMVRNFWAVGYVDAFIAVIEQSERGPACIEIIDNRDI